MENLLFCQNIYGSLNLGVIFCIQGSIGNLCPRLVIHFHHHIRLNAGANQALAAGGEVFTSGQPHGGTYVNPMAYL